MFSLAKHFDDGPQIPSLIVDAYRYFARLARDYRKPTEVWLYDRYPTYSFYTFDERAVIALYSNATAKKDLPAFEITRDSLLGQFLSEDTGDLKKECRRRTPEDLEAVIRDATAAHALSPWDTKEEAEADRCVRRYQFAVTAPGQHSTSSLNDLTTRPSPTSRGSAAGPRCSRGHGHVVREQLQRNAGEDRRQHVQRLGNR